MTHSADFAVVGAGILGLAHAAQLARAGKRVVVFERHGKARGASVRNFGMIWPIGQAPGLAHETALRSREIWLATLEEAGLPYSPCGSLHAVYRDDERDVAREFAELGAARGYDCVWLEPEEAARRSPVEKRGLLGGLFSAGETIVDPWVIIESLPAYLEERFGVQFRFGQAVREVSVPWVDSGLERWQVEGVIVCGGDDFETLYPECFGGSGITRVKLQMMRTAPQPPGWTLGPALAAGLTLRFYPSFRICPSLEKLRRRIAAEMPEYDRWGIHVMASQTQAGEVTIGDSHEYGLDVDPFDKTEIDELVLRYLRSFLPLPVPVIAQRWNGIYAKHPDLPWFCAMPAAGVRVVTAPGGAGMTLSFGIAERTVREVLG